MLGQWTAKCGNLVKQEVVMDQYKNEERAVNIVSSFGGR